MVSPIGEDGQVYPFSAHASLTGKNKLLCAKSGPRLAGRIERCQRRLAYGSSGNFNQGCQRSHKAGHGLITGG